MPWPAGAELTSFCFKGAPEPGKTESVKQIARVLDRVVYAVNFSAIVDSRLAKRARISPHYSGKSIGFPILTII